MNNNQWHPGNLLEISGSYWRPFALHAAVALDLFTAIGSETPSAMAVAQMMGTDTDGTARLLDALAAMKLIVKKGDQYQNTPEAQKFLSQNSDSYIGHMIMHHHHLVESWNRLDEAVVSGKPIEERKPVEEDIRRKHFLMGMFNTASQLAPSLVKAFDLSSRRNLLDLGGGPGTYAIHFCRQNPGLNATVFDLPTTRPFAEKTIARFELSDRIDFSAGNYLDEPIPGKYDVIWMSHILHSERPRTAGELIQKAAATLESGGMLMIHDFFLDESRTGPLFPALFSLNMLVRTQTGRSYTQNEVAAMLTEAGLKNAKRHAYKGPTESSVMSAIR